MSQSYEATRALLLGRIRTALIRLDSGDTPDNATLEQLVPLLEKAASIVQTSGHHAAGHFLSFLQAPDQVLTTEATTPTDADLSSKENAREGTSLPLRTAPQPPVDSEIVAHKDTQPVTASKAGCFQPPYSRTAKRTYPTHTQSAPPGTSQSPIGGRSRPHPY